MCSEPINLFPNNKIKCQQSCAVVQQSTISFYSLQYVRTNGVPSDCLQYSERIEPKTNIILFKTIWQ